MGSTLSLALSESNTESGHHYIILEGYKFKLEWEGRIQGLAILFETYPASFFNLGFFVWGGWVGEGILD